MQGNRRSVLKALGVGTAGILAGSTVGSAKPSNKYSGLAYDPVTHETLGAAEGQFETSGKEFTGRLKIDLDRGGVVTRSVERESPDEIAANKEPPLQIYTDYEERNEKTDEEIIAPAEKREWVISGRTVTGVIRKRSRAKIAFTLFPESNGAQPEISLDINREEKTEKSAVRSETVSPSPDSDEYEVFCYSDKYGNESESGDEWRLLTYLSNEADSRYNPDELPNGEFSRWNLQSYFINEPSGVDYVYDTDYFITCIPGLNPRQEYDEDPDIQFTSEHPRPSDSLPFEFGITIGASYGPISAGPSVSTNLSLDRTDFEYNHSYSEWVLNTSGFATSQDDNDGVYLTNNVSTDEDFKDFEFEVEWHWTYDLPDDGRDPNIVHVYETGSRTTDVGIVEV